MTRKDTLVKAAVLAFLSLAASTSGFTASQPASDDQNTERCYGVVKTGMNDCATATAKCAGSAAKDGQPDAFVLVPKGLCNKLVGGSLTASPNKENQ